MIIAHVPDVRCTLGFRRNAEVPIESLHSQKRPSGERMPLAPNNLEKTFMPLLFPLR